MEKIKGTAYAIQAMSDKYTGIKYSKLDCQAFVEEVLKDAGVRKPDGSVYNWKGSNSMWRNALSWKGTIDQCRTQFGEIPPGAWVFIVKRDGGEKEKGYNDNEGNTTHVGIYCRHQYQQVRDSTRTTYRDGVGYRDLTGFTHVGLPKMILYNEETAPYITPETKAIGSVNILRDPSSTALQVLDALKTLTKYLRGV